MKRFIFGALAFVLAAFVGVPAMASQGSCVLPTSGTLSGLTLVQNLNDCFLAVQSANSGATAPNNIGPNAGMLWLDTSTNRLKLYDGNGTWLSLGYVDASGHFWEPPIGGGAATLASATTTDLCSIPQSLLTISGTTTISSFGSSCQTGNMKVLSFSGILTLTHNGTSLILPNNGNDITTAAGDRAWAAYLGAGNWVVVNYQRANGTSLNASAVFTGAVAYASPISITLASNTNNWAPAGFATANVVRLTCSSALNVTGLTGGSDGRRVIIENVGTNNCNFTNEDSASTAANRFTLSGPQAVRAAQSFELVYDGAISRWRTPAPISALPVAGGFRNLVVTNVATPNITAPASPNAQMKIVVDAITVENGSNGAAYRLSPVSVTPSLAASGANGLDTGSVASNTWYFSYVIYNPTGAGTTAGLWSTASSCSGITLPANYTACARVGANVTDGSNNLLRVVQYGRRAQYVVGTSPTIVPVLDNGVAGTYSSTTPILKSVSVAGVVPSTAASINILANTRWKGLGGGPAQIIVAPNTSYGGTQNGSNGSNGNMFFFSAQGGNNSVAIDMILESAAIAWASDAAGGALGVTGWEDNL